MPAGSPAILAAAHEARARGDLSRQAKGRIILEVQDGDIVVAEDAAGASLAHFVMDRASLFTDQRKSGLPIRAKF